LRTKPGIANITKEMEVKTEKNKREKKPGGATTVGPNRMLVKLPI